VIGRGVETKQTAGAMRLFIGGGSRLPARFGGRLGIDPCPVTHMTHQPSPGDTTTTLPVAFDLILGTCVPLSAMLRSACSEQRIFLTACGLFDAASILADHKEARVADRFLQLIEGRQGLGGVDGLPEAIEVRSKQGEANGLWARTGSRWGRDSPCFGQA
jgi:hypothetical protein